MRAFIGTAITREQLLASLHAHHAAYRIVRGAYWQGNGDGRGCAVGCSLHDFYPGRETSHSLYPTAFGVPEILAHLEDRIFEGLPEHKARDWPLQFAYAIHEGADLSRVGPAVLYRLIKHCRDALTDIVVPTDDPAADRVRAAIEQTRAAIGQTLDVLAKWRDTGFVSVFAASSARDAADSAMYAAASATYAASSAMYAASSAMYAADSASFATYDWLADVLIEEIGRAPVGV